MFDTRQNIAVKTLPLTNENELLALVADGDERAFGIIFHHYPNSPFSEKVRIAFGIKQLAWKSVEVPNILPKPDLMPLTGGYRKTPVMQIGADIFCDSQIILRELERRYPTPAIMPNGKRVE